MAVEQVQDIVDGLAGSIRRAVAVDDHALRLVAVSEDFGDADPPRVWSLLHRRTRPEDVDFDRIAAAECPVRLPAKPALELAPRLVIPLRRHGLSVGFMWLIERDGPLADEALKACCRAAEQIADLMHQRLVVADRNRDLIARLLEELTDSDGEVTSAAAEELRYRGLIADDSGVGVLVARAAESAVDLEPELHRFAGFAPPRTMLVRTSAQSGLVLVSRPSLTADGLAGLAAQLHQALRRKADGAGRVTVGASTVLAGLRSAPVARRQATIAAEVAGIIPDFQGVAAWDRMGPYALLGQVPRDVLAAAMLPAGLGALLERGGSDHLLSTVETFLDCGGDKQRAAALLHVHRATLYYRLERVEALTGLSLSNGADRLLIHLAVKLGRLHGLGSSARLAAEPPAGPGATHAA
jgi:hypothetical protein